MIPIQDRSVSTQDAMGRCLVGFNLHYPHCRCERLFNNSFLVHHESATYISSCMSEKKEGVYLRTGLVGLGCFKFRDIGI